MRLAKKEGITFIEILITTFVMTIGIASALLYFTTAMAATELARDTTVATTHAEYILEEMKTRATLAEIYDPANNGYATWQAWVATAGLTTLPNETITVTFPNGTVGIDPLNIATDVEWTRKSKTSNITLTTELTK